MQKLKMRRLKVKFKYFLSVALLASQMSFAVSDKEISGELYKIDSNKQQKLYNFKNKVTELDGIFHAESTYSDQEMNPVVIEKADFKGPELIKYEIDHKQLEQVGTIEVKEGQVLFSKTESGKTKTAKEKAKENLVVPPSLVYYTHSKWSVIMSGKNLEIRLAVWDRLETVGFRLKKIKEIEFEGNKAILVKMDPTSFIIRALVDPIYFTFAADGSKLYMVKGRTAPKIKEGSQWKDLDAEIYYK